MAILPPHDGRAPGETGPEPAQEHQLHARLARALYLPKGWTDARERCGAAGVPEGTEFATKPRLAERMLARAWGQEVAAAGWARATAGGRAKGPREYDGAVRAFGAADDRGWRLWVVVRRHRDRADERADDLARGPAATAPAELVRAAGSRWRVEECLERAKGDCGLGEYEVRSWVGWHRHVTLSLLALAVVAAIRAAAGPAGRPKRGARGWYG